MKKLFILVLISAMGLLTACSQSPLDSLKQTQTSKQYGEAFWAKQQSQNTALWQKALAMCKSQSYQGKPNCSVVMSVEWFESANTNFPKYQDDGFGASSIPTETPPTTSQ